MGRIVAGWFLMFLSTSFWFFFPAEVVNYLSVGVIAFAVVLGVVERSSQRKVRRSMIMALVGVGVGLSMCFLMVVNKYKADEVAEKFLEGTPCRVNAASLLALNDGWMGNEVKVKKSIRLFGATRELHYQNNGLFRYGFLLNQRDVWIPSCDA